VGAVALTTLVVYPLKLIAADISLSVVYLLGVLFIASYWGAWLGIATAFAGALAFNYFPHPTDGPFHRCRRGELGRALGLLRRGDRGKRPGERCAQPCAGGRPASP
jgi:hypothetical protein